MTSTRIHPSDLKHLGRILEQEGALLGLASSSELKNLHRAFVELARGVEALAKVHPPPWEVSAEPLKHSVAITDGRGAIVAVRDFNSQAVFIADDFNRAVAVVKAVKPHLPWRPVPHE